MRERIKMAVHVLRGRPLMYRMKICDGSVVAPKAGYTWINRCYFSRTPETPAPRAVTFPTWDR